MGHTLAQHGTAWHSLAREKPPFGMDLGLADSPRQDRSHFWPPIGPGEVASAMQMLCKCYANAKHQDVIHHILSPH